MSSSRVSRAFCFAVALTLAFALHAQADVRLPGVFGDHMVLQRDVRLPVWGWASPKERITVRLAQQVAKTRANNAGEWRVDLDPMQAGGPHQVTVSGKSTVSLTDALVGEVWICSGQSNMAMTTSRTKDAKQEMAEATHPNIRLYSMPRGASGIPMTDVPGTWQVCAPGTVRGFSAVAYFFGRELSRELGVPVGLISTSWGGTRIEPWTPPVGFASVPAFSEELTQIREASLDYRENLPETLKQMSAWAKDTKKAIRRNQPISQPPRLYRHQLASHRRPTGLYNAMVHPLVPFAIKGAIWYQGEANVGEGMLYRDRMEALIRGWRAVWQTDLAFLYVQLAPYRYNRRAGALPELWESQQAALGISNTGMAVTMDIGNVSDIHPRNKQDVGKRLALWALAKTYGKENLVYSGPLYRDMSLDGDRIRVRFDHTGSGLATKDGQPPTWFTVAGADSSFVEAVAEIQGNEIVVSSPKVPNPIAVRYAWDEEAQPNLSNKEGLPAAAFRTDNW